MKLLFWVLVIFLYSTSISFAYIDDTEVGEAETLAGDQNTNLYRLQSSGTMKIKKFKEIDKLIEQRKATGKNVDVSDIETLIMADKQDKEEEAFKAQLADVEKLTSAPKQLRINITPDIYEKLVTLQRQNVRDRDVAAALISELKLGRR